MSVGLALGHDAVWGARLSGSRLVATREQALSGDGPLAVRWARAADALLREAGWSRTELAVAIPGSMVRLREVPLAVARAQDVRRVIRFAAEEHLVGESIDDYVLDHHLIAREGGGCRTLVAAVPRAELGSLLEALGGVGIDPLVIELAPTAALRALARSGQTAPVLVGLEPGWSWMAAPAGEAPAALRCLATPAGDDALAQQVRLGLMAFDRAPERIGVVGEARAAQALATRGLPAEVLSEERTWAAYGAGLAAQGQSTFDLRQGPLAFRGQGRLLRRQLALLAQLLMVASLLLCWHSKRWLHQEQQRFGQLEARARELAQPHLEALPAPADDVRQRVPALHRALATAAGDVAISEGPGRPPVLALWVELSESLAAWQQQAPRRWRLRELAIEDRELVLRGEIADPRAEQALWRELSRWVEARPELRDPTHELGPPDAQGLRRFGYRIAIELEEDE